MRSASNHNNSSFKKNMSTQPLSIQRLRSAAPMVPPTELTWPRTRSTRIAHALLNFVSAYMYLLRNALTHSFGFLSTILCLFAQQSIKPQLYPENPNFTWSLNRSPFVQAQGNCSGCVTFTHQTWPQGICHYQSTSEISLGLQMCSLSPIP